MLGQSGASSNGRRVDSGPSRLRAGHSGLCARNHAVRLIHRLRVAVAPHRGAARGDRYAKYKDKFKEPTYLQVLGFLYTRFGALPVQSL